jgi:ParB/RepB/Spo0J family partition protein
MSKPTKDQELGIRNIAVGLLYVSEEETRKTIDQAALAELAKSIELQGMIEPMLVRPAKAGTFEIVAGQRRWLASKLASQRSCKCVVREMSDEEARELRIISNLQREDLPPMEEADAYGKLLEQPGATIETVAAALAKTPSYVGRRVQLLKAIEPVRAALRAGAIEVGHALELARLSDRMQGELLARLNVGGDSIDPNDIVDEAGEPGTCRFCGCTEDNACAAGCSWANEEETICDSPKCLAQFRSEIGEDAKVTYRRTLTSVAELRNMVERQSLRVLSSAPFPLDHDLAPMPCTDCPKRSTNAVLLFDDCAQDTCTDRRCYDAKVGAWVQAELVLAKSEKRKLLKLTQSWSSDKERIQVSDYSGAKLVRADHICESQEEGIWVDGEDIGQRASICRNQKCETHYGKRSSSSSSSHRVQSTEKEKADRRKILDKVKSAKAYRSALVTAIAAASVDTRTLESLQIDVCCAAIAKTNSLYAAHLARAIGWDEKLLGWNGRTQLRAKVTELSTVRRFLIARLCEEAGELSVNEYNASGKCEDLEKLAKLVGVDSKKLKIVDAAAKPAPAKAVKPKKSILSAASRKRIAEAQKKRWSAAAKKKAVRK